MRRKTSAQSIHALSGHRKHQISADLCPQHSSRTNMLIKSVEIAESSLSPAHQFQYFSLSTSSFTWQR